MRNTVAVAAGFILALTVVPAVVEAAQARTAPLCPGSLDENSVVNEPMPDVSVGKAAALNNDYALAYRHFHPLAQSGNSEAQRELGLLLLRSCYGDRSSAILWIRKAAAAGDVPAAAALGRLYMNGDGV